MRYAFAYFVIMLVVSFLIGLNSKDWREAFSETPLPFLSIVFPLFGLVWYGCYGFLTLGGGCRARVLSNGSTEE